MKKNQLLSLALATVLIAAVGGYWLYFQFGSAPGGAISDGFLVTPECSPAQPGQPPRLSNLLVNQVNTGKVTSVLVPRGLCYRAGITGLEASSPPISGITFLKNWTGAVTVLSIKPVAGGNLSPDEIASMGFPSLVEARKFHSTMLGIDLNSSLYLIRFKRIMRGSTGHDRTLPSRLSAAQTVDLAEGENLTKKGALWIDVRPSVEYGSSHHPLAKNVPYFRANPKESSIDKVLNAIKGEDRFELSTLPKDRHSPIIFSGRDFFDVNVVGAILLTYLGGWDHLFWYRDGEAGRLNLPLETPPFGTSVSMVNPLDLSLLVKAGGKLVDTRSALLSRYPEERELAIKGAIRAPYNGSDEPCSLVSLNLRSFMESGDQFSLPLPPENKEDKVIFYGEDKYDWSALKAAMWAKESGWSNVYWFREGLAGWRRAQDLGSSDFATEEIRFQAK